MTAQKTPAAGDAAGRSLNLDERRAARAEKLGDPVIVTFGGRDFELPVEMPAEFAFAAQDRKLRDAVIALFGDQAEEFLALRPSVPDIEELAEGAAALYGVSTGGAEASPGS